MAKPDDELDLIPAFEEGDGLPLASTEVPADELALPDPITRRTDLPREVPPPPPSGEPPPPAGGHGLVALSADELFGDLESGDLESPPQGSLGDGQPRAPVAAEGAPPSELGAPDAPTATPESSLEAAALFDGVAATEAPEPAPWSTSDAARVTARIEQLDRCRSRVLEAYRKAGEDKGAATALDRTREEGRELLADTADVIESVSQHAQATETRQQLVDAYFRLQRAVEQGKGETEALVKDRAALSKKKDAEAAAALARRAQQATRGRRTLGRVAKLIIFLGVLVAVRLTLLLTDEGETTLPQIESVRRLSDNSGVVTRVDENDKKPEGPVIQSVALTHSDKGLHAHVLCTTHNIGDKKDLRYTYTWFENDQILGVGAEPTLSADKLKPGARYHFEVRVSDDEYTTSATSEKLVVGKSEQKGM